MFICTAQSFFLFNSNCFKTASLNWERGLDDHRAIVSLLRGHTPLWPSHIPEMPSCSPVPSHPRTLPWDPLFPAVLLTFCLLLSGALCFKMVTSSPLNPSLWGSLLCCKRAQCPETYLTNIQLRVSSVASRRWPQAKPSEFGLWDRDSPENLARLWQGLETLLLKKGSPVPGWSVLPLPNPTTTATPRSSPRSIPSSIIRRDSGVRNTQICKHLLLTSSTRSG